MTKRDDTPQSGRPLTEAWRGQLCDGDWLREDWNGGRLVQHFYPDNIAKYRLPHTTFIGRPDADGWIAAPEGGWKENPVPGVRVEWRNARGMESAYLSDEVCGLGRPLRNEQAITHIRLPTDRRAEAESQQKRDPKDNLSAFTVMEGHFGLNRDAQHLVDTVSGPADTPPSAGLDAAWRRYENDFNAMSDAEIESETRRSQDQLEEAENWLEAVAAWDAAGRPRKEEV